MATSMKALDKFMTRQGEVVIYMATSAADAPSFWTLMGPWFASRVVAETLGEGVYDHDAIVWTLALVGERCVGFGAIDLTHIDKGDAHFNYAWVAPENRHSSIYRRILSARVKLVREDTEARRIIALCTADSAPTLAKLGFSETSKKGRYTRFVLDIKR